MNEHYRLSLVGWLYTIPVLPLFLPLIFLEWLGDWAAKRSNSLRNPGWPYFTRSRELVDEVHKIVPAVEIRRRLTP